MGNYFSNYFGSAPAPEPIVETVTEYDHSNIHTLDLSKTANLISASNDNIPEYLREVVTIIQKHKKMRMRTNKDANGHVYLTMTDTSTDEVYNVLFSIETADVILQSGGGECCFSSPGHLTEYFNRLFRSNMERMFMEIMLRSTH